MLLAFHAIIWSKSFRRLVRTVFSLRAGELAEGSPWGCRRPGYALEMSYASRNPMNALLIAWVGTIVLAASPPSVDPKAFWTRPPLPSSTSGTLLRRQTGKMRQG